MRKIILVAGVVLVTLNTLLGLMWDSYSSFNMVMVDFSLVLSTLLLAGLYYSSIADGFKIGLTVWFLITAVIRIFCAIIMANNLSENISLFIFLTFLGIEVLCLFVGKVLQSK
jgi:hypothetical protein